MVRPVVHVHVRPAPPPERGLAIEGRPVRPPPRVLLGEIVGANPERVQRLETQSVVHDSGQHQLLPIQDRRQMPAPPLAVVLRAIPPRTAPHSLPALERVHVEDAIASSGAFHALDDDVRCVGDMHVEGQGGACWAGAAVHAVIAALHRRAVARAPRAFQRARHVHAIRAAEGLGAERPLDARDTMPVALDVLHGGAATVLQDGAVHVRPVVLVGLRSTPGPHTGGVHVRLPRVPRPLPFVGLVAGPHPCGAHRADASAEHQLLSQAAVGLGNDRRQLPSPSGTPTPSRPPALRLAVERPAQARRHVLHPVAPPRFHALDLGFMLALSERQRRPLRAAAAVHAKVAAARRRATVRAAPTLCEPAVVVQKEAFRTLRFEGAQIALGPVALIARAVLVGELPSPRHEGQHPTIVVRPVVHVRVRPAPRPPPALRPERCPVAPLPIPLAPPVVRADPHAITDPESCCLHHPLGQEVLALR
mmetsp:Transcript_35467/g.70970  ORF Transcript_35467/g.70970 Transcript_35467/m.70970 type:complete len:477 (-) Transcript_35467:2009-3439(-)